MSDNVVSLHVLSIALAGLGAAVAYAQAWRWNALPVAEGAGSIREHPLIRWFGGVLVSLTLMLIAGMAGDATSAFALSAFLIGLLYLAIVDARTLLVPVLPGIGWLAGGLAFALFRGAFVEAAISAALLGCALWLLARVYRHVRGQEGLGAGDALILAALAAWLGLEGAVLSMTIGAIVLLAYVCARVGSARDLATIATPFVPGAAIGAVVCLAVRGFP